MDNPEKQTTSPWVPLTDPKLLKPLGKLLEELGEATSAASRCLIQGFEGTNPETGQGNLAWLENELADVAATICYLDDVLSTQHIGYLNLARMEDRSKQKYALFLRWHAMEVSGGQR